MQNGYPAALNGSVHNAEEKNGTHPNIIWEKLFHSNALPLDEEAKVKLISNHFKQIMLILGLDLEDDSLKGTPDRVAKMYVNESFSGLNPDKKPALTLFENNYAY